MFRGTEGVFAIDFLVKLLDIQAHHFRPLVTQPQNFRIPAI